jgi:hypothetical protein
MVRVHLGLPVLYGPAVNGGDVAQLVERLVCNQEVVGSSPIVSTSRPHRAQRKIEAIRLAQASHKLFDKLGWWKEIVEDLE